jgi:hypothetical protein
MKVKAIIIDALAPALIGGLAFRNIKKVVATIDSQTLSNEQKHERAYTQIREMAMGILSWAIDLGIKLAVTWLRSKQGYI